MILNDALRSWQDCSRWRCSLTLFRFQSDARYNLFTSQTAESSATRQMGTETANQTWLL